MSIAENYHALQATIPVDVMLVGISKFHPESAILEAYEAGIRTFGESRVQELVQKQAELPKDIEWHFIGHLQSNKIKTVLPLVTLIQSIDSTHLMDAIEKEAFKQQRPVNGLIQVHIAREETKFGFSIDEAQQFFQSEQFRSLQYLRIIGLMGMATYTEDQSVIRQEFRSLKTLFDEIRQMYFVEENNFNTLSMGMTGDYTLAIEEGSTMVRIGTALFGLRPCAIR
ncbi:YggS family pyridoxal phosphate-dependent enzyme [Microbacter margulisiae]|uniref:Pyridoxal phosphate homeostasis protein n=1 Tax=Microbacter margulisiae TaxID=1350067 RepID=A0A7W5H238_9PORP|nr:YggS family pyridoxal phosphate-dependent enzyme [Microbacter margulisiae]MBB3187234.1 hypothetical protein [Microbacter margulisiae]